MIGCDFFFLVMIDSIARSLGPSSLECVLLLQYQNGRFKSQVLLVIYFVAVAGEKGEIHSHLCRLDAGKSIQPPVEPTGS
jgi:hypothetical protein